MQPHNSTTRAEMHRREVWARINRIAAFAGLAVGTGIAALIAWRMGTLQYFWGGF